MAQWPALKRQNRLGMLWLGTALGLGAMAMPALAQDAPAAQTPDEIGFAADTVTYDQVADRVEAKGNVILDRDGYRLIADIVTWDRRSGVVMAEGNVRTISPAGDIVYGDRIELTDSLKDGAIDNILLVLADGGRLVANRGTRNDGKVTLEQAAYTPCAVESADGCPKEPTWQVKATKVKYDPVKERVSYDNARIELFGLPVVPLPGLSHSVNKVAETGILVPDIRYSRNNGLEVSLPYY